MNNRNNILNRIIENNDQYSWKDLTCTYRPWMVAFNYFGECYKEAFLLLVSFVEIYLDDIKDKMILDFQLFYKKYLEKYFGICIKKNTYTSLDDMVSKICKTIDDDMPILVPCDLYELHYNPMYKMEHRYKCMVVKGYDIERELIYILDNIHIDYGSSTKLTDFVCKIKEINSMNETFSKQMSYEKCFFSLKRYSDNNITTYNTLGFLNCIIKKIIKGEYKKVCYEKIILEMDTSEKKYTYIIEEIIKILDFKFVFIDNLSKMLNRFKEETECVKSLKTIYEEWKTLRVKILYEKELGNTVKYFMKDINRLEGRERKAFLELSKFIEGLEDRENIIQDKVKEFRILDNSGSEIVTKDDSIIIKHSKKLKYDTWLMQDNAVQLLLDDVGNGYFSTCVNYKTGIGEDTHAGIIIKMQSGKKYLFGNVRGEYISIYCPELRENFDLYTRKSYMSEDNSNMYFKICICDKCIKFYCRSRESKKIECVLEIHEVDTIKSIGLFSKTWEYLDHKVKFYNLDYRFD